MTREMKRARRQVARARLVELRSEGYGDRRVPPSVVEETLERIRRRARSGFADLLERWRGP